MMGHNSQQMQLDKLAVEITNAEGVHEQGKIEHALAQGARIRQATDLLPHGKLKKWISEKISLLDYRSAVNFRNLHDWFGHTSPTTIRKIGMSRCYKLKDDLLRAEVIKRAEDSPDKWTDEMIEAVRAELYPPEPEVEALPEPQVEVLPEPEPEVEALPEPEPQAEPLQLTFNPDLKGLRKRQSNILSIIENAGASGISRDDLMAHPLAESLDMTPKHIDTNIAPLFVRGLVVAVERGQFVAVKDRIGVAVDVDTLPDTHKAKVEAAKRRLQRGFDVAVQSEAQMKFEAWRDSEIGRMFDKITKLGKRVDNLLSSKRTIDPDDYRALRKVMAPQGNPSEEARRRAWDVFQTLGVEPLSKEELERIERAKEFVRQLKSKMVG